MDTTAVDERAGFARDVLTGQWSMTELCERYGVTRPTGDKWVARYRVGGDDALTDRSRAPHHSPQRTAAELETLVLAARQQYGWGARKLLQVLRTRHPTPAWPARSTLNALLDRHGLLRKQRRPRRWTHPGAAPVQTDAPNQVWPADFKGQFKTGDGRYCYRLTVTDHFSRTLLVCRGLPSVRTASTQPVFRALFREHGLPDAIRTDNGAPFASPGIHGLSQLNVWWMPLGIVPHEGIGDRTPASLWTASIRPYPERITPPCYPAHLEVRRVSTAGTFSLHARRPFLTEVLRGQDIGLEEVGDGIWNIVYYRTLLGRLDERTLRITGV